jgi:hypothetical protein
MPEDVINSGSGSTGGASGWVGAGAQLVGTAADIYFTNQMNKQTQAWNEEMYSRQRQDAIDDWNRMNAYNSPSAQMSRWKDAGLNSNLIYGQGTSAASSQPRGTDAKSWQPSKLPVGEGISNAIGSYQNFAIQDEQVKNMQQQRKNMEVDNVLKTMDIATKGVKTAQSEFDLQQSRDLKDTAISTAAAKLRGLETATDIKVSKEVRDIAMSTPKLAEAFQKVAAGQLAQKKTQAEIAQINAQIANLSRSGTLQDMEIAMRKLGLSYNDDVWMRMLAQFADGKSLPEVIQAGWDQIHKLTDGAAPSALKNLIPLRMEKDANGEPKKWSLRDWGFNSDWPKNRR